MLDDLKFAWRRLRHAPGFSLAAIATLALAIGANTAIFSIADAVLFRPLPYAAPDGVDVLLVENRQTARRSVLTPYDYLRAIDDHHRGVSEVARLEDVDIPDPIVATDRGPESVPIGVFGVVAFLVASRTHEMGVRTAIGASPASLIALMVKQTIVPVAAGLVLGLAATRGASRLAGAQLFNVKPQDPLMLAAAAGTVILTSVVAAYWPARRAGRVDPAVVLRAD